MPYSFPRLRFLDALDPDTSDDLPVTLHLGEEATGPRRTGHALVGSERTTLRSRASSRIRAWAFLVPVVGTVVAIAALGRTLDPTALGVLAERAVADPTGWAVALGGFGAAFVLRALAWQRLLPSLGFGHSIAAIHVALGANHLLPFRLGEPLRVLSVVRRAGIPLPAATASTIALRVGDVIGLVVIGVALAPSAVLAVLGWTGGALVAALTAVGVGAAVFVGRLAARSDVVRAPDPTSAALTLAAWGLEALLVRQVAFWGGLDLSWTDALLVTAVAVSAQIFAITPGGIGTYEAAAVAGLTLVGVEAPHALTIAVAAHALKTSYSLVAGAIFVFVPSPGFLGRLRLPRRSPPAPAFEAPGQGPVVLFLPAHNEEARVSGVIERAPAAVGGRAVRVLVVDDGSLDATAAVAGAAGADVVALGSNRGLGRAVAEGLRRAVEDYDASVVVFCDADGEYDPAEIGSLVEPVLAGEADYVVGSRFAGRIEHMHAHRRVGNLILTRWVRWMTRRPVTDGQSGYRALSAQAAREVRIPHDYNYAQVLTIDALQRGYRYAEVPIGYRFRRSGTSFVRLGRYLRQVVPTVLAQLQSPPHRSVTDGG